ncbi:hypothetical protein ANTPLA_LOCUS4683 [Anthophora plagiata]
MLSKLSFTTGSWNEALSKVEYAINNTFNRSIGNTPCKLLFGVNQTGQVNDDLRVILEENDIRDLNAIRENAVAKIQTSNEYNKQYYNKRHKYPTRYLWRFAIWRRQDDDSEESGKGKVAFRPGVS